MAKTKTDSGQTQGELLDLLMARAGLNPHALARLADMTASQIYDIRAGRRALGVTVAKRLAVPLKTRPGVLLQLENEDDFEIPGWRGLGPSAQTTEEADFLTLFRLMKKGAAKQSEVLLQLSQLCLHSRKWRRLVDGMAPLVLEAYQAAVADDSRQETSEREGTPKTGTTDQGT